jgi:hypothetical protein
MARRLIAASRIEDYEARLRAAVALALAAQVDSITLTLHRHGLTGVHLTAASNPDGSSRKKAAAAATAAIVVPLVWSQQKWAAYVKEYLAQVARDVATDAALDAADGVAGAATWGMATTVDASVQAIIDRALAAGQAIGDRLDQAGISSSGDVAAGIQSSLDSAGTILGDVVGAMGQALGNTATTDIASYIASVDPTNAGGATKIWNTQEDDKVRPDHEDADGQEVGIGETFSVGGEDMTGPGDPTASDAQTINCLIEGSTVIWPGELQAVFRRRYSGDVVKLTTADGHQLTVTPNHPVLTASGWVAAEMLNEGDEVGRADLVEIGSQPDVDHVPPPVEEVYRAAREVWATTRVGGAGVDFHGDGSDAEVEVVRPDGELRLDGEAGAAQVVDHRFLIGFGLASGGRLRPRARSGGNRSSTTHPSSAPNRGTARLLGRGGQSAALGRRESSHPDRVGLADGADGEAKLAQTLDDDPPGTPEMLGDREHAFAVVVKLAKLVEVQRETFHGYVYNLTTSAGWYITDNLVHHNCRCWVELEGV